MDSLKESVALHLLRFLFYANGFNPAYEACKREKKKHTQKTWNFSAKLRVSHLKCLKDGEKATSGAWAETKEARESVSRTWR